MAPSSSPSRAARVLLGAGALPPADHPVPARGALSGRPRLLLLSFLMLFTELALIRWTGAKIIFLSYYSNFVLLGSFLGIGLGFLRARSRVNLSGWAPVALALLIFFVVRFPVQVANQSSSNLLFFSSLKTTGLPTWATLPVIFLVVAAVTAIAFLPIFLANMVFAQRFREVGDAVAGFGANLLGAMVGGVLEYASLVTGYRALLIVVAVLYGLAFLTGRRHLTGTPPAMAPAGPSGAERDVLGRQDVRDRVV